MICQRFLQIGIASVVAITTVVSLTMIGCATYDRAPRQYGYVSESAGAVPPAPPAELMSGPIVFKNLLFANNKSNLNPEAKSVLDEAAALLRAHPADSLLITGYASDLGSASYNTQLGLRRAEAVKAYLVGRGIDADRLEVRSAGEAEPAVPNTSSTLRTLNRRVVLTYIKG